MAFFSMTGSGLAVFASIAEADAVTGIDIDFAGLVGGVWAGAVGETAATLGDSDGTSVGGGDVRSSLTARRGLILVITSLKVNPNIGGFSDRGRRGTSSVFAAALAAAETDASEGRAVK